jgi:O-antigen ligase
LLSALVAAAVANDIAVWVGFDAYAQYVADFGYVYEQALTRRPSGLVGNSNLLSVQAVMPVFAIALWPRESSRLMTAVAMYCAGHAMLVSGSRKGLLIVVFALVALAVSSSNSRVVRLTSFTAILFGLVAIAAWVISASPETEATLRDVVAIDRMYRIFEGTDGSFSDRFDFLNIGWNLFTQSPLWGHGLDTFRHLSKTGFYAHNNFIELGVSGGLILIAAFYAIHLETIRNLIRDPGSSRRTRNVAYLTLATLLILDVAMVSYNVKITALFLCLLIARAGLSSQNVPPVYHGNAKFSTLHPK